jgi:hypothetical protein
METQKYHSTTRTELAQRYGVSMPTFKKWLMLIPNLEIADNIRTLTPKQVEAIFIHLGEPS